jgi:hypothetical protein
VSVLRGEPHSSYLGGLGLVVAGWVQGEFADQFSIVLGDDPSLQIAREDQDLGASPAAADAYVAEPTAGRLGASVAPAD